MKSGLVEDVIEGLVVHIVHESHQPVVGSLMVERDHQRKKFGHVRCCVKATLVKHVHGLVLLTFSQQGLEAPPRQSVAPVVNACLFKQVQTAFQLSGRA